MARNEVCPVHFDTERRFAMTKNNKLTRPWGGPGTQTSIGVREHSNEFRLELHWDRV